MTELLFTGGLLLAGLPLGRALSAEAEAGAVATKLSGAGKTAVVTGSTDGLGKAVALQLAAQGVRIIVHGRNRERGEAVVAEINKLQGGNARFYAADFASMAQVRTFADALLHDCPRIDLLINNAGIGSANANGDRARQVSADGFKLRFAVNYLSGFLLTRRESWSGNFGHGDRWRTAVNSDRGRSSSDETTTTQSFPCLQGPSGPGSAARRKDAG